MAEERRERTPPTLQPKPRPTYQQLDLLKGTTSPKVRRYATNKVAKHPPNWPTTTAKHPSGENSSQRQGGKASARAAQRQSIRQLTTDDQRDLDDEEETKRRQVQKWILPEKSHRPPPVRASKKTPPGRERRKRRRRCPTIMAHAIFFKSVSGLNYLKFRKQACQRCLDTPPYCTDADYV